MKYIMNLLTKKKIIEYDMTQLNFHMIQCKKENCLKKSIRNTLIVSYNFFTGKIITTSIVIGIIAVIIVI